MFRDTSMDYLTLEEIQEIKNNNQKLTDELNDLAMKYSVQKMESEMGDFYFAYVVNYVTIPSLTLVRL